MHSPKALSPLGESPLEHDDWVPLEGAADTTPTQWRPGVHSVANRRPEAKQKRVLKAPGGPLSSADRNLEHHYASDMCVDTRFRAGTAPPKEMYSSPGQRVGNTPTAKKGVGRLSPLMGDSRDATPLKKAAASPLALGKSAGNSQTLLKSRSLPQLKDRTATEAGPSPSRGGQPRSGMITSKMTPQKERSPSPRGALPPVDGNLPLLRTAQHLGHVGVDSHAHAEFSGSAAGRAADALALRSMVSSSERLNEIKKLEQYPRMPRRGGGGSVSALCEGFSDQL